MYLKCLYLNFIILLEDKNYNDSKKVVQKSTTAHKAVAQPNKKVGGVISNNRNPKTNGI